MKRFLLSLLLLTMASPSGFAVPQPAASELEKGFVQPPDAARPWVYWFWLNGNITSNGITADLEAMKRVGIGGVLIMEVDQGAPLGRAPFGGSQWRGLFQHVCAEAHRLGLEVNMNNDAGWCGSGGPWITPELAMQKLVWTETNVVGPLFLDASLAHPQTVSNYYGDIALFAFPTPLEDRRIENIQLKAAFIPERVPPNQDQECPPATAIVHRDQVLNLTKRFAPNGTLKWQVPSGRWTILRLGHTPTGKDNHPAPEAGRGLESDKLSRAATDVMFNGLMKKLIADSKPLAGSTLVATHIDSWETGSQNWTPRFREDFERLRGYDPLPFLPVITGRILDSVDVSERFLWDLRQTVSDLLLENYAGRFGELAHRNGLRLSIEAYDRAPCDEMMFAGRADEPMAEFWSWGYNTAYSCTEMTSAAHVYGKRIIGAEAFTANDGERWLHHPATIKTLGDWAFCEGINRFVFHRYALQPWLNIEPGMSMGPWGLHYERTQTWWEQSAAWHQYLSRCQFMLRQGLFVADICYLQPEGSPQRFTVSLPGSSGNTPDRHGYNFDGCTPEVLLSRMQVKQGRLVLPDGMSYRLLVLPQVETMTPALLRRISTLIRQGATVVGSPPAKSPSLANYPACDREVTKITRELWGDQKSSDVTERKVGAGRLIFGDRFMTSREKPNQSPLHKAKWVWHNEGNPAVAAPVGTCYFRRVFPLEVGRKIESARMVITADNAFELWINGRRAGEGDNFKEAYKLNVKDLLKPGTNVIAVAAHNGSDKPNPAGLIAALIVHFSDGSEFRLNTDRQWQSATKAGGEWLTNPEPLAAWRAVLELGPVAMAPWNGLGETPRPAYAFPPYESVTNLLASMHVPPDFESTGGFRFTHRQAGDIDIYFVANPSTNWVGAECRFRVAGKTPELWSPLTGAIKQQKIFEQRNGQTIVPLWLEPAGSVFVIFGSRSAASTVLNLTWNGRKLFSDGMVEAEPPLELAAVGGTSKLLAWQPGSYQWQNSQGETRKLEVPGWSQSSEIGGPWEIRFEPRRGAPVAIQLDHLLDWTMHSDPGVKYFSGHAAYTTSFKLSATSLASDNRLFLDLGQVAVIAQVKLNGADLGTLWKTPYRVDVTRALHVGENKLEVTVVNLWINRMIGDEQLPEDSVRNPNGTLKQWPTWLSDNQPNPAGRVSFTSWRLWKKDSPLQESGLLGPVRLLTAKEVQLNN
jgi:hypothetical protein